MDLDKVWYQFTKKLERSGHILSCEKKFYAGLPFLIVHTNGPRTAEEVKNWIADAATGAMRGKQLNAEMTFVRSETNHLHIFRFRFLVPNRKMFCCGNLCHDCILFKNR